jgi:hypothetical protein
MTSPTADWVKNHKLPSWLVLALLLLLPLLGVRWSDGPERSAYARFAELPVSKLHSVLELRLVGAELSHIKSAASKLTGTAQVYLYDDRPEDPVVGAGAWDLVKTNGRIYVFLGHRDENGQNVFQGQSDGELELAALPYFYWGSGTFSWKAETVQPVFLYPWDVYKLFVNPRFVVPTGAEGDIPSPVGTLSLRMAVPGLFMVITEQPPVDPALADQLPDTATIELRRSRLVKYIVTFVGLMALFLLYYFAFIAKPSDLVLQSLGFFTLLWAIRSILVADVVSSSPIMIDYVTIGLYAVVAVTIVVRWTRRT